MSTLDGRRVYTRAELTESYGVGRSTLEKWYRERSQNGHPESAGAVGAQLAWDADAWDRWFAQRQSSPAIRPGLATRDDLMAAYGLSRHALKKLWAGRDGNGHPKAALQIGKALYWEQAEWASWYAAYEQKPSAEGPDDLVTLAEAARILGLAQTSVTVYPKRPPRGWPEPAKVEHLAGGRVRRLYRRADVLSYDRLRRG